MDDQKVAYLAGLLDGDGSIGIYKQLHPKDEKRNPHYLLQVIFSNTDRKLVSAFKDFFGFGYIKSQKTTNKTCYSWVCAASNAMRVLELLLPYLVSKKDQAKIGITFQTLVNSLKPKLIATRNANGQIVKVRRAPLEVYEQLRKKMAVMK